MTLSRRQFVQHSLGATLASFTVGTTAVPDEPVETEQPDQLDRERRMIIDTHQHLWDREMFRLPWLNGAPEVLQKNYRTADYKAAVAGANAQAIYMEVDVDPAQHLAEAVHVVSLCRSDEHPTVAAVVGGRPASPDFATYVDTLRRHPEIKGIRQVLHNEQTPEGYCLQDDFVKGIRRLGEIGLSFDLCLRPTELASGVELARCCPDTRFIVDHCGNADPKALGKTASDEKPWHEAEPWKREMAALADLDNTICKISGIVARAPQGWRSDDLAPIVNHCLDSFGPDRVVFGSDWPVCLLGGSLRQWMDAADEIVSRRPDEEQARFWRDNARRWYRLEE